MNVIQAAFIGAFFAAFVIIGVGFLLRRIDAERKKKPKRKSRGDWLTIHQLRILSSIAEQGRKGIALWQTDVNISTIRSLAKRGYVDTRKHGRIIATGPGLVRLSQPWPADQPTGDQKDRGDVVASGGGEIAPTASGEASQSNPILP
jgi:hypothetical protein